MFVGVVVDWEVMWLLIGAARVHHIKVLWINLAGRVAKTKPGFLLFPTDSLLSKMQLLRRSSKCLMRVVCRCSLAERDGAVVAEPNRPLFQLSPAGAAAGRAGRDDGREAAAGGTLWKHADLGRPPTVSRGRPTATGPQQEKQRDGDSSRCGRRCRVGRFRLGAGPHLRGCSWAGGRRWAAALPRLRRQTDPDDGETGLGQSLGCRPRRRTIHDQTGRERQDSGRRQHWSLSALQFLFEQRGPGLVEHPGTVPSGRLGHSDGPSTGNDAVGQ